MAKILPFVKKADRVLLNPVIRADKPSETLTAVLALLYPEVEVPEPIKGEEEYDPQSEG